MIRNSLSGGLLVFLLLTIPCSGLWAQASVKDSAISMVMIRPSYGLQVPAGDLAKRFGFNQSVGMGVSYKNKKGWMITAEGAFIFGTKINEPNLFSDLTTSEGTIIGSDGLYGDIRVFERGYYATLGLGKIFKVKKPNPNCGFIVEGSLGFIQHKIKIQDKKNAVPALQGEYLKGYDKLTNGLAAREFVGFLYIGNHRLVNFFGGLEAVQGWTAGRRSYDFNSMKEETGSRFDMLFGIRVGWVIPLFKEAPEEFYLY
ncbi:MAG: hypothetical protein JNL88_08675 [Bacteroidia bacterium]|nr:hypothetical protein [Bacteroidia bacterium]